MKTMELESVKLVVARLQSAIRPDRISHPHNATEVAHLLDPRPYVMFRRVDTMKERTDPGYYEARLAVCLQDLRIELQNAEFAGNENPPRQLNPRQLEIIYRMAAGSDQELCNVLQWRSRD